MAFPQKYKLASGEIITLREAEVRDAAAIMEHTWKVIRDSEYMLTSPEEFTISETQEKQWIKEHIDHPGDILLVAEEYARIIGVLSFKNGRRKRTAHTGTFGISIKKQMRGKGVGKLMILSLLDWAGTHPLIEKVSLEVFATNENAIRLYKKLDFHEEGRKVNHIKLKNGGYTDELLMSRFVKNIDSFKKT